MEDNKICLRTVSDVSSMKFFIPAYQRGYRWTEQQVIDLLNDVNEFQVGCNNSWYCLQPLVVRLMNTNDPRLDVEDDKNGWYEVIDGQQRLTTTFLIIHYLNEMYNGKKKKELPFIKYETRKESYAYMSSLEIADHKAIANNQQLKDCIDFHYMKQAYQAIDKWVDSHQEFDENEFQTKFIRKTQFIWYESVEKDPIKVFTRLNIGKIALTNAELIKALFLNRSNFNLLDDNHLILRQQEIASEWDNIEYTLQNDEFWLFLHEKGYSRPTRIDFIFDLICAKNESNLTDDKRKSIGNDDYKTFRYFYEDFRTGNINIEKLWKEIKDYFQIFKEWYDDVELYHYVGYLIVYNYKLSEIIDMWQESDNKTFFVKKLKKKIKHIILKQYSKNDAVKDLVQALEFQYKEDGGNKGKCKPILLFHNIQTAINQNKTKQDNEKYKVGIFYKFPFHLYKLEQWDVEHINSNTTNPEEDVETREEWLLNMYLGVDEETQEDIKDYFEKKDSDESEDLYVKIQQKLTKNIHLQEEWNPEKKNKIWNYTLLDSSTNRSYGNAIFSGKRRVIIGKDKGKLIPIPKLSTDKKTLLVDNTEQEATSSFVPLCTKQAFMKYYSSIFTDPNYWTLEDAKGYKNDIQECLEQLEN